MAASSRRMTRLIHCWLVSRKPRRPLEPVGTSFAGALEAMEVITPEDRAGKAPAEVPLTPAGELPSSFSATEGYRPLSGLAPPADAVGQLGGQFADRVGARARVAVVQQPPDERRAHDHPVGVGGDLGGLVAGGDADADADRLVRRLPRALDQVPCGVADLVAGPGDAHHGAGVDEAAG